MEAFTDQALHYQRMTFPLDSLMSGEQRQVKQGLVEQRMYREQETAIPSDLTTHTPTPPKRSAFKVHTFQDILLNNFPI